MKIVDRLICKTREKTNPWFAEYRRNRLNRTDFSIYLIIVGLVLSIDILGYNIQVRLKDCISSRRITLSL